jgi:hypothetical protein
MSVTEVAETGHALLLLIRSCGDLQAELSSAGSIQNEEESKEVQSDGDGEKLDEETLSVLREALRENETAIGVKRARLERVAEEAPDVSGVVAKILSEAEAECDRVFGVGFWNGAFQNPVVGNAEEGLYL